MTTKTTVTDVSLEVTLLQHTLDVRNDSSQIPHRASPGAAGYDLRADEDIIVWPWGYTMIHTGTWLSVPEGHVGLVRPRSGLAMKWNFDVRAGVIDSDYRGGIVVLIKNEGWLPRRIKRGDRIAQLVIVPVFTGEVRQVDELPETERNTNGFGSSGVQ